MFFRKDAPLHDKVLKDRWAAKQFEDLLNVQLANADPILGSAI